MGEKEVTTEVGEAVANGTLWPTKSDKDATKKKDGRKEREDLKDDVKDKNEAVNVVKEGAEVSKDDKEEEKKELKEKEEDKQEEKGEDKRKEKARSEAMEVDNEESANKQSKDKGVGVADLVEEEIKNAGSKKGAAKKSGGEKGKNKKATEEKKGKEKTEEPKTPISPSIDRPVRERKTVERLVAVIEKDNAKEFHIEKGRGTALKDIPNVAYKLSKRKVADETLKLLHTILFGGRRGKALLVKSNILQFSGFVWHENEEKPKAKVQEKLDKCNKEKLFEFCDLLDIPVTRTTAKKEDVIAKLIDFVLVPHATTSKLVAEKEESSKGSKRKRPSKKSASPSVAVPSKNSSKKQKTKNASEEPKDTPDTQDSEEEQQEEDKIEDENVNGALEKSESEEHLSEPESAEDNKKRKRVPQKSSPKQESTPKSKSKKESTSKKSSQKKSTIESTTSQHKPNYLSQPITKTFSRKKKKNNVVVNEKPSTPKKSPSKEKTGRKDVKEKEKPKQEKQKPSDEELKTAILEILKEVDFNTATFTDILKQLNTRFNTELGPRKATVKLIIQDELQRIADEEADDEEDEGEPEKPIKAQKAC